MAGAASVRKSRSCSPSGRPGSKSRSCSGTSGVQPFLLSRSSHGADGKSAPPGRKPGLGHPHGTRGAALFCHKNYYTIPLRAKTKIDLRQHLPESAQQTHRVAPPQVACDNHFAMQTRLLAYTLSTNTLYGSEPKHLFKKLQLNKCICSDHDASNHHIDMALHGRFGAGSCFPMST